MYSNHCSRVFQVMMISFYGQFYCFIMLIVSASTTLLGKLFQTLTTVKQNEYFPKL